MSYSREQMRIYQKNRRERLKHKHDGSPRRSYLAERDVLLAWESGKLSEGQASKLLNMDRISLRMIRDTAIAFGMLAWTEYRRANPPVIPPVTEGGAE